MTYYRFYSLDERGKVFVPPAVLQCSDDEDALVQGQTLVREHPIEIWDGGRRVATLLVAH